MSYETWKITLYDVDGGSCAVCPSFLDDNNPFIKYKIPNNKPTEKNEEKNGKTITKMLRKKQKRYVDKRHKSNIKRKTSEFYF